MAILIQPRHDRFLFEPDSRASERESGIGGRISPATERAKREPRIHLMLHLTDRCNLACTYCYEKSHVGPLMTAGTAREAINKSAGFLPTGGILGVHFFGGEPLLAFDTVSRTVSHAEQLSQPIDFHISTKVNQWNVFEAHLQRTPGRLIAIWQILDL